MQSLSLAPLEMLKVGDILYKRRFLTGLVFPSPTITAPTPSGEIQQVIRPPDFLIPWILSGRTPVLGAVGLEILSLILYNEHLIPVAEL